MKTCPTCHRTFEETLTFCLVDGSVLSAPQDTEQTISRDTPADIVPNKTEVMYPATRLGSAPLPTMVAQEPPPYPSKQPTPVRENRSGNRWLVLGIAIPLVLVAIVGAVIALIWLGSNGTPTTPTNLNVANVNAKATPTVAITRPRWGPRNERASLNGTRLTYYPVTTPSQCQTDCDKEESCRGFTFIRSGAYNPNDSAMCYLMSEVTGTVETECCISAIKN